MHYLKCYQDYGDIIKEAISKSRNLDQVTSAHTLVLALRKQYQKLLQQGGGSLDKEIDIGFIIPLKSSICNVLL